MTNKGLKFLAMIMILFGFSCANRNSHGEREKAVGQFVFKLREVGLRENLSESMKDDICRFVLEIAAKDVKQDLVALLASTADISEQDVLYYLSYTLQEDIYMLKNGVSFSPVLYHFERSFDLKPNSIVVNLGFEDKGSGEHEFIIDSEIFDIGIIKLKLNR